MPTEQPEFEPIENHAVIGDLHTVALVSLAGTIDFLCFPSFDSPTVFASLLDPERGGYFSISPTMDHIRRRQLYLPDSNILLTRFLREDGVGEVSDFMPLSSCGGAHTLVRRVKTVRGELHYRMVCDPRFDYGLAKHTCHRHGQTVVFRSEKLSLRLHSSVPITIENGAAVATFTLRADEKASFVLEEATDGGVQDLHAYVSETFKRTLNYWRDWVARSTYSGRWREMVTRSALTLKLLVSQDHGSLVAAPTFGLPEVIGGARNWDYRYTWIRDASFTIYALMRLGYTEEAGAFNKWIEARCRECAGRGRALQIMYGIDGRHDLTERKHAHFSGYRDSRPVLIGNGAYDQLQLDIYGELIDSVYLYDKWGEGISFSFWQDLARLVEWVCLHWRKADEGIWEVRGGRQQFLYSRLMCWVALDRGIRLARKRSFPAPLVKWLKVRDAIFQDIHTNFWDPKRGTFLQHKGSLAVDAATLLMPMVRFISPTDPQWLSTLATIEKELVEDSLVHRYRLEHAAPDGFAGQEGTFSMCTFWYAECKARAGDVLQGRFIFDKMLGYANHVGLYAEQLGTQGEHLGNFPQAFTHLGLISAAFALDRELNQRRDRRSAVS